MHTGALNIHIIPKAVSIALPRSEAEEYCCLSLYQIISNNWLVHDELATMH